MTSIDAAGELEAASAAGSVAQHARASRWRFGVLVGMAVALVLVSVGDVMVGGAPMPLPVLVRALVDPASSAAIDVQIVWAIRLPMTATALVCGAALAMSGAQMQTVLGNPLAEPYTLGIASAASFGAALAVVSGFAATTLGSALGIAGSAWFFAMVACAVILGMARIRGRGAESMILIGIAIVFGFDALLALMQYLASVVELEQVVFWTLGSLTRSTWPQIGLMAGVLVVCSVLFISHAWTLTALRLGDDRARSMGVPVDRARTLALVLASLLAATAVSMAGTIGFIGLIGPHIARMLMGEEQRFFLPASTLCGALLLTGASLVAKVVQPGQILPVGIITAIVGVPLFLVLVMGRRQRNWS